MLVRITNTRRVSLVALSAVAIMVGAEQKPKNGDSTKREDCCSVDLKALTPGVASQASLLQAESATRFVEGNINAVVRVVIYEDLQCPDCAGFRQMMDRQLLPRFGDRVAFEHRDFPLPKHAWARRAAATARYLDDTRRDLGVRFRAQTLSRIREINSSGFEQWLADFAAAHSLDRSKLVLPGVRYDDAVERDFQEGIRKGVAKTPTVFVAGAPFVERFTPEAIAAAIEQALASNPK